MELLDGVGRRAVEAHPVDGPEGVLDRIAHQSMHEAVPAGLASHLHESGCPGLVDQGQAFHDRSVQHAGDHGDGKAAAHDGSSLQQTHAVGRETTQPRRDRILNVSCCQRGVASLAPVGDGQRDLAHEERVPAGQGLRLQDLAFVNLATEHPNQLAADGRRRQPAELDPPCHGLTPDPGQERVAAVLGVAVVDDDEQSLVGQDPGDMVEQQQRGLVGPVRVVEDDQQRLLQADLAEQPGHGVELAKPILGRAAAGRWWLGRDHVGGDAGQLAAETMLAGEALQVDAASQRPQDLAPRPERRRAGRLGGRHPRTEHTAPLRHTEQLLGEPGLADPGLALAHDDPRETVERGGEAVGEHRHLRLSTNELRPHRLHLWFRHPSVEHRPRGMSIA